MKNLVRIILVTYLLGGVAEKTLAQTWNVTGNAGTDPNVQFIGTTDSKAFKIRTNNFVRMMIKSNGDVGVGTQTPTSKLHVNGVITATGGTSTDWNTAYSWGNHALAGYLTSFTEQDPQVGNNTTNYLPRWNGTALETSNLFNSGNNFGFNTNLMIGAANLVLQSPNVNDYGGMTINQTGSGLKPFYGYATNGTTNCWTYYDQAATSWKLYNAGDRLTVNNAGNVGIGTTSPVSRLSLVQTGTTNPTFQLTNTSKGPNVSYAHFGTTGDWYIRSAADVGKVILQDQSAAGTVAIGTTYVPAGYKLAVSGKVICSELKVQLPASWPDYVFGDDYSLMSLADLRSYVNTYHHLPGIPSAAAVESNGGVEIGEMQRLLMEKVEELTLYILQQEEKIRNLETTVEQLKK